MTAGHRMASHKSAGRGREERLCVKPAAVMFQSGRMRQNKYIGYTHTTTIAKQTLVMSQSHHAINIRWAFAVQCPGGICRKSAQSPDMARVYNALLTCSRFY